jgi:membrane protein DedA with SNARE-associated domain
MELLGLGAIVGLIALKEAGVPIPVPGDLVVIGAGIAAASGSFNPLAGIVLIVGATIVGGTVHFLLVRGPGRLVIVRLLERLGVPESRIERLTERLRRSGARGVAVARMTPGIRIVAVAAAALAALPFARFLAGLAAGNAVFTSAHFALGFVVGRPAVSIAASLGTALVVGVVVLAIVGGAGWWALSRRRSRGGAAAASASGADWADAACPACLLLAAVSIRTGENGGVKR